MSRKAKRWLVTIASVFVGLLVLGVIAATLVGVHTLTSDAEPFSTAEGFPYQPFDDLLASVVRDGRVDYEALHADRDHLNRFVATLETTGPRSTPELFSSQEERKAYYINAYNALVLFGVMEHWPIESVHDVHGMVNVKDGFGFFWAMRFRLDGRSINLYDLEHDILRVDFSDARIHAAIDCASASCPALRPHVYSPELLNEQLDAAASEFASNAPHVEVSIGEEVVRLSSIYDWFSGDFVGHAEAAQLGDDVLSWIIGYASEDARRQLEHALGSDFAVEFVEYDWTLNGL